MSAVLLPATLRAALALRLAAILASLAALLARTFLRDPFHGPLILPLWRRITRAVRRFDRLIARVAAGTPPRKPSPAGPRLAKRAANLPGCRTWLVVALRHEAVFHARQLNHLLSDPEVAKLLAEVPQAARILRPICRMLGIRPAGLPPLAPRKPRQPRVRIRIRQPRPKPFVMERHYSPLLAPPRASPRRAAKSA